jgi:2-oxoglutarate dehydrogenase complex dehydrogenase (E1) component-like enzyme
MKPQAGKSDAAILAMKAEQDIREAGHERANQLVTRWQKLKERSQQSYERGEMGSYRSTRSKMASMAEGLERDPQLESLLANRKRELGIDIASGRSLGRELAFNHGLDLGRGLRAWIVRCYPERQAVPPFQRVRPNPFPITLS